MYLDNPINSIEEDKLQRANFSKSLAQAIKNYDEKKSFVIGICGQWGSGKTSVIHMILEELNEISEKRIDVINFSAWNYSSHDDLIMRFFQMLKTVVPQNKKKKKVKEVIKLIDKYAFCCAALKPIPVVGDSLVAASDIMANAASQYLSKDESLDNIKQQLSLALGKIDKKIIVVIDDIDRLSATHIREIFQLVNQVADLPNIIYILSMDREMVSKVLKEVQQYDGDKYLEKIIQVTYNIPEMDENILRQLFFDRIKEVFGDDFDNTNNRYFHDVYTRCIKPYLKNIRDINRIANSLILKKGVLLGKVVIEDLVVMTCIELLQPKLHNWIYDNKEFICVGGLKVNEIDYGKNKTYEQNLITQFSNLKISNPNNALEVVSRLFPNVGDKVDKLYDTQPEFANSICNKKVLESYYAMSIHMRGPVIAT